MARKSETINKEVLRHSKKNQRNLLNALIPSGVSSQRLIAAPQFFIHF